MVASLIGSSSRAVAILVQKRKMPSYLMFLRGLQSNNGFGNNTCASVSPSLTSAAVVLLVRKSLEDFVPSTLTERMNVWNPVKMPQELPDGIFYCNKHCTN